MSRYTATMNFLAHCLLAQPNAESLVGNLLGDFTQGADFTLLPQTVILGLKNHQAVDKFTDQHDALINIKQSVSKQRRRYAGIMADVVFDYYLVKYWGEYSQGQDFDEFVENCYKEISSATHLMHPKMLQAMKFMVNDDGLRINRSLKGVGQTLDRVAKRIRFENQFAGAIEEIESNYEVYETAFLELFPDLQAHIISLSIEIPSPLDL